MFAEPELECYFLFLRSSNLFIRSSKSMSSLFGAFALGGSSAGNSSEGTLGRLRSIPELPGGAIFERGVGFGATAFYVKEKNDIKLRKERIFCRSFH